MTIDMDDIIQQTAAKVAGRGCWTVMYIHYGLTRKNCMNKTPLALILLLCGGDTPMTLVDYPGPCTK